jgi:hypothetical protein
VTADQTDEVHRHGYDRKVDIAPGRPAELEEASLKLVELQVS